MRRDTSTNKQSIVKVAQLLNFRLSLVLLSLVLWQVAGGSIVFAKAPASTTPNRAEITGRFKPPVAVIPPPTSRPVRTRSPTTEVNVAGNVIDIEDDSEVNKITIRVDGVLAEYVSADLETINVELTGLNNSFKYRVGMHTDRLLHKRNVSVEGGELFDSVAVDLLTNYPGWRVTVETALTFNINTYSGADNVEVKLHEISEGGAANFNIDLGPQADSLNFLAEAVNGDLNIISAGGSSELDDFQFSDALFDFGETLLPPPNLDDDDDVAEPVLTDGDFLYFDFVWTNIGPNGNLTLLAQGGHDHDTILFGLSGEVMGDVNISIYGDDLFDPFIIPDTFHLHHEPLSDLDTTYEEISARESDAITVNILIGEGSNGSVQATVLGGVGGDQLILQVLNEEGANPQIDALIDGGEGGDYYYATGHDDLPGEDVVVENVEIFDEDLRID